MSSIESLALIDKLPPSPVDSLEAEAEILAPS